MKLGIDPGISGAIALLKDDTVVKLWDMPISAKTHGKGNMVNAYLLADIVTEAKEISHEMDEPLSAVIEQVGAMPGQGVTRMFNFGSSFGIAEGVLGGMGIAVVPVTPQRWKKQFGLMGREKDASRTKAISLYPEVSHLLKRKKDNGRADAIFIGSAA